MDFTPQTFILPKQRIVPYLTKGNSSRRKIKGNIVFRGLHDGVSEIGEDLRGTEETFYFHILGDL